MTAADLLSLDTLRHAITFVLVVSGGLLMVVGGLGLLRMPDVFTRMHGASLADTLGVGLLLLGMMVEAGFTLITVKLIFLLALLWFVGPFATHALASAALKAGIVPWTREHPRAGDVPSPQRRAPTSARKRGKRR